MHKNEFILNIFINIFGLQLQHYQYQNVLIRFVFVNVYNYHRILFSNIPSFIFFIFQKVIKEIMVQEKKNNINVMHIKENSVWQKNDYFM